MGAYDIYTSILFFVILVGYSIKNYTSVQDFYNNWKNELIIGAAYFFYQITDDIPMLITGRSPIPIRTNGKTDYKKMGKRELPRFIALRILSHLSRANFVILASRVILHLSQRSEDSAK